MKRQTWIKWILWLALTATIGSYLVWQLAVEEQKPDLLIGESSHGHYQIEMQCGACHTSPFGGTEVLQDACLGCHQEELKEAMDSHPLKKFTDPRNADRIKILDARNCIACHREHNPDITRPMAVTLPEDYCLECHQDVGEERKSHEGLGFETCASSGCHNFHDNRALYENFLLKHAHDPRMSGSGIPSRNLNDYLLAIGTTWDKEDSMEIPEQFATSEIAGQWQHSAHGNAEVACTNCHVSNDNPGQWLEKPDHQTCATCHRHEVAGFLSSKHGMRLNQGLAPMTPGQARLPMHENAAHKELTCNSCHSAHEDNTARAATEACLGCHADDHSLAFKSSPHFLLDSRVADSGSPEASRLTCATCHMPRIETMDMGVKHVVVEHNQNSTLRPNDKMIRPVCMNCHGLGFAIDALADEALIKNNFNGLPKKHIESIDMAIDRDKPTTY